MKTVLKIAGFAILAVIAAAAAGVAYLTIREYKPDPVESLMVPEGKTQPSVSDTLTILSWNTGYAGLSSDEDFFMDGGSGVQPGSKELVLNNMQNISSVLKENPADVYFLQEADIKSKRSYSQNQAEYYGKETGLDYLFAYNFKCDYVPYPLPPIGHVESGLVTLSDLKASKAERIALPESFQWPVKVCNLKRCLLSTRIPIKDTDKELVLINLHLEAYDSGEGKKAQSKLLAGILEEEYQKGNYVIAGGDFNQTFSQADKYPIWDDKNWVPPVIEEDSIPEGFQFAVDDAYPTCRLLNAPYTGSYDTSQVYVLDGYIVSPNVKVNEVRVINTDFKYTDHQPVKLTVVLEP